MAYADFDFYINRYYGSELTEADAPKWLERASDAVDSVTFHRLEKGMPGEESQITRVKKAVCALADVLYRVEQQRVATAARKDVQGNLRPAVSSMTSGKESVSYSQSMDVSVYAKAASDSAALNVLLQHEAERYLANTPDADGVNLLYAGVR